LLEYLEKTIDLPQVTDKKKERKYWNQLTNYNIKTRCSSDCIGRCKSNYNTITAMMDPQKVNIDQVKIQYNRCSGQYQSNLLNFWDTYKP
jgi:hypothetical protein